MNRKNINNARRYLQKTKPNSAQGIYQTPIEKVIGKFTEIAHYYFLLSESDPKYAWKAKTYIRASEIITENSNVICCGSDALKIKGIGKSVASDIDCILEGKETIRESTLKKEFGPDKYEILTTFTNVWGIGPSEANRYYNLGCRSLEDLVTEPSLKEMQRAGLRYFEDIKERIPRREIELFEKILTNIFEKFNASIRISCPDENFDEIRWCIGGSYRRGNADCGDIDILIEDNGTDIMPNLIEVLKMKGIIEYDLMDGENKYFGMMRLHPDMWARRIDISCCREGAWPFALIHATGSKKVNVALKKKAIEMGLELREDGLFCRTTGHSVLEAIYEKDIFDFLKVPYLEPHERN